MRSVIRQIVTQLWLCINGTGNMLQHATIMEPNFWMQAWSNKAEYSVSCGPKEYRYLKENLLCERGLCFSEREQGFKCAKTVRSATLRKDSLGGEKLVQRYKYQNFKNTFPSAGTYVKKNKYELQTKLHLIKPTHFSRYWCNENYNRWSGKRREGERGVVFFGGVGEHKLSPTMAKLNASCNIGSWK